MRRRSAYLAASGLLLTSLSATAQDVDAWNAERADVFATVCMGSAPSFAEMEARAIAAGFEETADGLNYPPEVFVSLREGENVCRCFMTVGALDPDSMIIALFERVIADYGDVLQHNGQGGVANDTMFLIEDTPVRVVFSPQVIENETWFVNMAIRGGGCPG